MNPKDNSASSPNSWDRRGLPAWSFFNKELLEQEKEQLFRRHWQLICHQSDIPEPGNFITCDFVGERALIVRGKDGQIRAFHNLCRTADLELSLMRKGPANRPLPALFTAGFIILTGHCGASVTRFFARFGSVKYGLKPIEMENWNGFIFVRFKLGPQPSIREILAPFDAEIEQYELADLLPSGDEYWTEDVAANWSACAMLTTKATMFLWHIRVSNIYSDQTITMNLYQRNRTFCGRFSRRKGGCGACRTIRNS